MHWPLTVVWTQCAGGCLLYLTASSMTPSLCNKPGLEHMEKPPTFSTPGMKKSTLHKQPNWIIRQWGKGLKVFAPNVCITLLSIPSPLFFQSWYFICRRSRFLKTSKSKNNHTLNGWMHGALCPLTCVNGVVYSRKTNKTKPDGKSAC